MNGEDDEQDVLLFICLFVNNTRKQSRQTTWVNLSHVHVYADLSFGLVSQKWLEKFPIHDAQESSRYASPNNPSNSTIHSKLKQQKMQQWALDNKSSMNKREKARGPDLDESKTSPERASFQIYSRLKQMQVLNW